MFDQPSTIAAGRVCAESSTHAPVVPLRSRPLEAAELVDEIEVLLDVIEAVSGYPNHLTSEQVDAALQLPPTSASSARHAGFYRA